MEQREALQALQRLVDDAVLIDVQIHKPLIDIAVGCTAEKWLFVTVSESHAVALAYNESEKRVTLNWGAPDGTAGWCEVPVTASPAYTYPSLSNKNAVGQLWPCRVLKALWSRLTRGVTR